MTKLLYFWLILLFTTTLLAQTNEDIDPVAKGEQILKDARRANGSEKIKINSFRLKTKSTLNAKFDKRMSEVKDEIYVVLPSKIRTLRVIEQLGNFTTTRIWNDGKYNATSETEFFGKRTVKDITNSSLTDEMVEKAAGKGGKNKAADFNGFVKFEPQDIFFANMWQILFPITLTQPFEQKMEFKYIGKAKSGNQTANILDVKSRTGREYRLLFDSETNFLLMMIETFKSKNGVSENRYYYSNREVINNISVPKKIKVEEKFTPIGQESRISYINIEISEFTLNPEFKQEIFDIK